MKKKLSRKESEDLWLRLRKEDPIFEDLCTERDKIVGIIEHHAIVKDALESEVKKWDVKIGTMFGKAIEREIE